MAENKEFPCFVADCSFIISYLLEAFCDDELNDSAKAIEYLINNNGQIYVPGLFWYEVNNVLLYKTRPDSKGNSRLGVADVSEILYDLKALPIYTDNQLDFEIMSKIRDLALQYNLSFSDASYLELSRRYNIPLKTYDKALMNI